MPESVIQRMIGDRQFVTKAETEDFLRDVAQTWEREREQRLWQRDYSSNPRVFGVSGAQSEAVARGGGGSVDAAASRAGGRSGVGAFFKKTTKCRPVGSRSPSRAAYGLGRSLRFPKDTKDTKGHFPSFWRNTALPRRRRRCSVLTIRAATQAFGLELVRAGYAVLAPKNVSGVDPRGRLQRLCLMLGMTLWGLEIFQLTPSSLTSFWRSTRLMNHALACGGLAWAAGVHPNHDAPGAPDQSGHHELVPLTIGFARW